MLKDLPHSQRQKWRSSRSWSWPRLADPQELLKELEAELGQEIKGREQVLHDLWPAADYPSLPLFARLELLLAGFDRTFVFTTDGHAVIRQMPSSPRVAESISVKAEHQKELQAILAATPPAKLSDDGRRLTASWRTHEQIRRATSPRKAKPPPLSQSNLRYTLRVKDRPLGPFLKQLSKQQLQLECEFSTIAAKRTNQMISFQVEKANLQELLTAILDPVSLDFSLSEDKLRVKDKTEP